MIKVQELSFSDLTVHKPLLRCKKEEAIYNKAC